MAPLLYCNAPIGLRKALSAWLGLHLQSIHKQLIILHPIDYIRLLRCEGHAPWCEIDMLWCQGLSAQIGCLVASTREQSGHAASTRAAWLRTS